jgi:hypothetical protein
LSSEFFFKISSNKSGAFIILKAPQFVKAVLKIVGGVQGQGKNRFKSGAYTIVFEHFESVFNTALGRHMHF